ncbi:transmembrane protease serine 9-like [Chrysoperla carnea]|uniref:transmembrane protease serine 9-like n=1 Tax=Chrysoperla carnea TaxID=189513 RepID=UPI001D075B4D|nr:transmembrane protease serine 9-like [Chrysoperla carnea]
MFRLSFLLLFVAIATICCTVRAQEVVEDDDKGTRIKGGARASQELFPYQVSLQFRAMKYVSKKICSGMIVGEEYIVTAAHCVDFWEASVRNYKDLYVVAGVTYAFDLASAQVRAVKEAFKHPEYKVYDNYTAVNDIAVLKLSSPLDFGQLVGQCELPEEDFKIEGSGIISGWGAIRNPPKAHQSKDLLYANVTTVPNEACDLLNDGATQFCAGGKDVNACGGDSGGPFAVKTPEGVVVCAGVISYGEHGCGDKPSVYTKISAFTDFIRSKMDN